MTWAIGADSELLSSKAVQKRFDRNQSGHNGFKFVTIGIGWIDDAPYRLRIHFRERYKVCYGLNLDKVPVSLRRLISFRRASSDFDPCNLRGSTAKYDWKNIGRDVRDF